MAALEVDCKREYRFSAVRCLATDHLLGAGSAAGHRAGSKREIELFSPSGSMCIRERSNADEAIRERK